MARQDPESGNRFEDKIMALNAASPRRQCRSCRDPPQCARRPRARSGARRAAGDRRRRRRHHRASARGSPPYPRRRHGAAEGRDSKPLNFEMAATEEMVAIALRHAPHACCLVPEKRSERTTEGGLDVVGGHDHLKTVTRELGAGRHSRLAVHRAASEAIEAAAFDRRAGRGNAHRRLVRCAGARRARAARRMNLRG